MTFQHTGTIVTILPDPAFALDFDEFIQTPALSPEVSFIPGLVVEDFIPEPPPPLPTPHNGVAFQISVPNLVRCLSFLQVAASGQSKERDLCIRLPEADDPSSEAHFMSQFGDVSATTRAQFSSEGVKRDGAAGNKPIYLNFATLRGLLTHATNTFVTFVIRDQARLDLEIDGRVRPISVSTDASWGGREIGNQEGNGVDARVLERVMRLARTFASLKVEGKVVINEGYGILAIPDVEVCIRAPALRAIRLGVPLRTVDPICRALGAMAGLSPRLAEMGSDYVLHAEDAALIFRRDMVAQLKGEPELPPASATLIIRRAQLLGQIAAMHLNGFAKVRVTLPTEEGKSKLMLQARDGHELWDSATEVAVQQSRLEKSWSHELWLTPLLKVVAHFASPNIEVHIFDDMIVLRDEEEGIGFDTALAVIEEDAKRDTQTPKWRGGVSWAISAERTEG